MYLKSLLCASLLAATTIGFASDPVHIMDQINTNGQWTGRLAIISANEPAYFTDADANNKGQLYDFTTPNNTPFKYGFGFNQGTDFNVAYSLTLTKKPSTVGLFTAKSCVFIITATSPANPDIRTESFNNANCSAKPGMKGDIFTAS